jgi:hypothetical protein
MVKKVIAFTTCATFDEIFCISGKPVLVEHIPAKVCNQWESKPSVARQQNKSALCFTVK